MQQSCNFRGVNQAERASKDPESLKLEELVLFHYEGLKKSDMKYKVTESMRPIKDRCFFETGLDLSSGFKISRDPSFSPESSG